MRTGRHKGSLRQEFRARTRLDMSLVGMQDLRNKSWAGTQRETPAWTAGRRRTEYKKT